MRIMELRRVGFSVEAIGQNLGFEIGIPDGKKVEVLGVMGMQIGPIDFTKTAGDVLKAHEAKKKPKAKPKAKKKDE